MRYEIKFNSRVLVMNEDSIVQALIRLIDLGEGITENIEFRVTSADRCKFCVSGEHI